MIRSVTIRPASNRIVKVVNVKLVTGQTAQVSMTLEPGFTSATIVGDLEDEFPGRSASDETCNESHIDAIIDAHLEWAGAPTRAA